MLSAAGSAQGDRQDRGDEPPVHGNRAEDPEVGKVLSEVASMAGIRLGTRE
jgi:hypothetical protein